MSLSEILQSPVTGPGASEYVSLTDEQLLSRHLKGDPKAFGYLVDRYKVELFQFLSRFLGDTIAAEDVFQDAFLQVHQSAPHFDVQRMFRPWLFAIAANKARDHHRILSRQHAGSLDAPLAEDESSRPAIDLLESVQSSPQAQLELQETRDEVKNAIDNLNPKLREVVLLAYFHQFSYQQISGMLEIPLGTVKSRLHCALAEFAQQWKRKHKKS